MKVDEGFFAQGALAHDNDSVRYIQKKYGKESSADFFELEDSEASLARFTRHWQAQGLVDKTLLDSVVRRIILGRLHPLQSMRIGRLLNDPSDDLEPEDKEVLIAQVLELEWPQAIPGGEA